MQLTAELDMRLEARALIRRALEITLFLLPPGYAACWEQQGSGQVRVQVGDAGGADLQDAIDAGFPVGRTPTLNTAYFTRQPHFVDVYGWTCTAPAPTSIRASRLTSRPSPAFRSWWETRWWVSSTSRCSTPGNSSQRERPVAEVWAEQTPEQPTVHVRDDGTGFDPAYGHKLFGVGLAIVRRIGQRHGGEVHETGALGQGATFSFSLPHMPSGEGRPGP